MALPGISACGPGGTPKPVGGLLHLPEGPGSGLVVDEAELAGRRVEV